MLEPRPTPERITAPEVLGARVIGFHDSGVLKLAVAADAIEAAALDPAVRLARSCQALAESTFRAHKE